MKKLFLLVCVWATLPAVAQTSKDKTLIIDASYLKQGSSYGQLGVHFTYYDSNKLALFAGLAGNFRSENGLVAIPEAQLSAWIRADDSHSGFYRYPCANVTPSTEFLSLLLRPRSRYPNFYFLHKSRLRIPLG